jgi:ABC-type glutathione transport system ATPase component
VSNDATSEIPTAWVRDLRVKYHSRHTQGGMLYALRGVSLELFPGETVGVIGESGAGKTTLGRVLLGLVKPTSGEVRVLGVDPSARGASRKLRGRVQVVLQNPDSSLNPLLPIWRILSEPLRVSGTPPESRQGAIDWILESVSLDPSLRERRPHELSGGQRQRVAIARAVVSRPELIVFDEAVTALDASVQVQVMNLIRDLQDETRFAALFISHDLAAVRYVSHRIAVAYGGELVETGPSERFYGEPEHQYSRELLSRVTL